MSQYADQFVLKGAVLIGVWLEKFYRPTRDIDLMGYGDNAPQRIIPIIQEICVTAVEPDAITYDSRSVRVWLVGHENRTNNRPALKPGDTPVERPGPFKGRCHQVDQGPFPQVGDGGAVLELGSAVSIEVGSKGNLPEVSGTGGGGLTAYQFQKVLYLLLSFRVLSEHQGRCQQILQLIGKGPSL
ncbi:MAG: nucleotidyl transferase AbiEii/AbiGii toxin family protein [Actinobacteria bacterium]|nr:nucleotidyl transferase AbiEii/AbiGii toxin family protein [Actinomycetota bacterium]MBU4403362.1 nucleotidyl transferase AbiEii/AbiGii toxin family protein [Actinomycetota bacterium]